jgi:hypothetical protein
MRCQAIPDTGEGSIPPCDDAKGISGGISDPPVALLDGTPSQAEPQSGFLDWEDIEEKDVALSHGLVMSLPCGLPFPT